MGTVLLVSFLVVHGLIHLAIWLPHPEPDAEKPPPFVPEHSAVLQLTKTSPVTARRAAVWLAGATAAAYVLAGVLVAMDTASAGAVAAAAAVLGLLLKGLYFNPWLSMGVLLDLTVLASAAFQWPVGVS